MFTQCISRFVRSFAGPVCLWRVSFSLCVALRQVLSVCDAGVPTVRTVRCTGPSLWVWPHACVTVLDCGRQDLHIYRPSLTVRPRLFHIYLGLFN